MEKLLIKSIIVGPLQTNCYLLTESISGRTAIIDPGGDAQLIRRHIQDGSLEIAAILLTHGHYDHIRAVGELHETYQCPVLIHKNDEELIRDSEKNLSHFLGDPIEFDGKIDHLRDGDVLKLGKTEFSVLETPGHTAGSVSFHSEYSGICVAGDTLFRGSIGRTDLPGGSHSTLVNSVKQKLFVLDESTKVYPGHGPITDIGIEKRENPFFHDDSTF